MTRFLPAVVILLTLTFASAARSETVSSQRAHDLATTYMMQYISLCGLVEAAIPHETFWERPIHVDKRSGTVSYPHHPTDSAKPGSMGEVS